MARSVVLFPFEQVPDQRQDPAAVERFMRRHGYRPVKVSYKALHRHLVQRLDLVLRWENPRTKVPTYPIKGFEPPPRTVTWTLDLCVLHLSNRTFLTVYGVVQHRGERYAACQRDVIYPERARQALTPKLRYTILCRDGHRCRSCGATSQHTQLHVDHIHPVSLGGLTTPDNLQTLCAACNLGKGAAWSPTHP